MEKTIMQVIKETRSKMKKKEVVPKGKLYYVKKNFGNCISLLRKENSSKYYVSCLMDLYGPFETVPEAQEFKKIIELNSEAHKQAMWSSWKSDPMLGEKK